MAMTKEVKTSIGVFVIQKPKAGKRNRSMIKAETQYGFSTSKLMFDLLPKCIVRRPDTIDQDVPIDQILDGLETEDYDLLAQELNYMINPSNEELSSEERDAEKKPSGTSSTTEESQKQQNTEFGS